MIRSLLFLLFLIDRIISPLLDSVQAPEERSRGEDLEGPREVFPSGYNWEVVRSSSGDVDVLPLREDHGRGALCPCNPRVDIEGAYLVTVHNSFDNREIAEEAVRIMNQESGNA